MSHRRAFGLLSLAIAGLFFAVRAPVLNTLDGSSTGYAVGTAFSLIGPIALLLGGWLLYVSRGDRGKSPQG